MRAYWEKMSVEEQAAGVGALMLGIAICLMKPRCRNKMLASHAELLLKLATGEVRLCEGARSRY